jgi:uncharacterized protein
MKSSLFPDVNVWLALTHDRHLHHRIATDWFREREETIYFCRLTQLGFLRLLTNEQVMGIDVRSQQSAWQGYHHWFEDERVDFHREPEGPEFETVFQEFSSRGRRSPKLWADAYLAAFAKVSGLTLVTFDRGFQAMASVNFTVLPAD